MKNKKIIGITILVIILWTASFFIITARRNPLGLTDEEIAYIEDNKETIFMVGYFPTAAERRFSEKLCKEIEKDTSLKLRIYDDTWNNTITLLKRGKIPVVMNMNKTEKRQEYTLFTESLAPISCGIYSGKVNTIRSFKDIMGKTIGTEKETALSESFPAAYPSLGYTLKVFDSFEETRASFERGEIDGFLSSKSYDNHVKGLHFFGIDTITVDTNHVGVSKDYPILHSILSKEIQSLKKSKWDMVVLDVINYELEKALVDFTEVEQNYLDNKEVIRVGLPTEYFLYAYGEVYNPKGPLPAVLNKIEFISNTTFVYEFDRLENLRLREDIDVYIDYELSNNHYSESIFDEEIIIVGSPNKRSIKEVYELSTYRVGIFGVPNAVAFFQKNMPTMALTEYKDMSDAVNQMNAEAIDYLIIPKQYFEMTHQDYNIYGNYRVNINRLVSGDETLIEIIDKCLFIIDTKKVVTEAMIKAQPRDIPYVNIIVGLILLLIVTAIYRLYQYISTLYYRDNEYELYNKHYLERRFDQLPDFLIMIEMTDIEIIHMYYGNKMASKYLKNLVADIRKHIENKDFMFHLSENKFLIAVEKDLDAFASTISQVESSMNRELLKHKINVCTYSREEEEAFLEVLKKMDAGIQIAKERKDILHLTSDIYTQYKNRVARDMTVKEHILKNDIEIYYQKILGCDEKKLGYFVDVFMKDQKNIYTKAQQLSVEIPLDKYVLSTVLKDNRGCLLFVKVSEATLKSKDFFNWLESKLSHEMSLYLVMDFHVYEEYEDILINRPNIGYAIDHFGHDLRNDLMLKYYDVTYVFIERGFCLDPEENEDVLECIRHFAEKNHKKIITYRHLFCEADYYIKEDQHENTDCGR